MNIIVTGSRDHAKPKQIEDALSSHFESWQINRDPDSDDIFCVIQGGARGADYHALCWCLANAPKYLGQIGWRTHPADWSKYGPSAGPRRNALMLDTYPDATVLAFPQGVSKGTRNCIALARQRGMTVLVYEDT